MVDGDTTDGSGEVNDLRSLLNVLLSGARSNVRIRQEFRKRGRGDSQKYFTYALLLGDGKIYVGTTNNVYQRLLDHFSMSSSSSMWVREHGPVRRVLEISSGACDGAEEERTLEYMSVFGWKNVRGSGWCKVQMNGPPSRLDTFERGKVSHDFMNRQQISDIVKDVEILLSELYED